MNEFTNVRLGFRCLIVRKYSFKGRRLLGRVICSEHDDLLPLRPTFNIFVKAAPIDAGRTLESYLSRVRAYKRLRKYL